MCSENIELICAREIYDGDRDRIGVFIGTSVYIFEGKLLALCKSLKKI